jgi:hypothetical protein
METVLDGDTSKGIVSDLIDSFVFPLVLARSAILAIVPEVLLPLALAFVACRSRLPRTSFLDSILAVGR